MLKNNRNPYDICLKSLLSKLDNQTKNHSKVKPSEKKEFIKSYRVIIMKAYEKLKEDCGFKEFLKSGDEITIIEDSYTDNTFFLLMMYQLLSEPPYVICNILDYHFQSTSRESDFVNRIEYFVFRLLNQNSDFFDIMENSTSVSRWISKKRENYPYTTASDIIKDNSNTFLQFITDIDIIALHLERHFGVNKKHFIDISNSPIDFEKVVFFGRKNSFIYLFKDKKLYAKGTRKKTIALWISKYFIHKNKKNYKTKLSYTTCEGVLTKNGKAPAPKNRIQPIPTE